MIGQIDDFLQPDGHLPFSGKGIQLAFGRRPDGVVIHISQATSGIFDRCVCPSLDCGRRLIAKKGKTLGHHFQHAPLSSEEKAAGIPPNCVGGAMTALHAFAESVLNKHKSLTIPPVEVERAKRKKVLSVGGIYKFESALLEKRTGDIVPDVVLTISRQPLLVEFFVTHRCSAEKIARIKELRLSAVEIDLSKFPRNGSLEQFKKAILHDAPRTWLYNRRHEDLFDQIAREEEQERIAAETKRADRAARRRREYARDLGRSLEAEPVRRDDAPKWDSPDVRAVLAAHTGGEGFFAVHPSHWKKFVLDRLSAGLHAHDLLLDLEKKSWLLPHWRHTKLTHHWNVEAGLLAGPREALDLFLKALAAKQIAAFDGLHWRFASAYREGIVAREAKASADERARAQRAKRASELLELAYRAARLAGTVTAFDYEAWESRPATDQSPAALAENGGLSWLSFRQSLKHLVDVLEGKTPPPADALGLPVGARLSAIQIEHDATLQEERRQEEAIFAAASERRLLQVESAFSPLTVRYPDWLQTPNRALDGATPLQEAAGSEEGLDRALNLARRLESSARQKEAWEKKLMDALERELGTRTKADLFAKTHGYGLPNDATPIEFVCSEETLQAILRKLRGTDSRRR